MCDLSFLEGDDTFIYNIEKNEHKNDPGKEVTIFSERFPYPSSRSYIAVEQQGDGIQKIVDKNRKTQDKEFHSKRDRFTDRPLCFFFSVAVKNEEKNDQQKKAVPQINGYLNKTWSSDPVY